MVRYIAFTQWPKHLLPSHHKLETAHETILQNFEIRIGRGTLPVHAQGLPKLKIGPILPYTAHSLSAVKPTISGLSRNPKTSTFVEVNLYTL